MIVAIAAVALSVQVVRNGAASALAAAHPASAARFWADHPAVELTSAMTQIAAGARAGGEVPPGVFPQIAQAARQAPLAPEPFLIQGVRARVEGRREAALRLFQAARARDPRSVPARYFLAEQYLLAGDAADGLGEVGALARIAPNGIGSMAPFVAAFAAERSHWPQLRRLFAGDSKLEEAVLVTLAQEPRNAGLILDLADQAHRNPDSAWVRPLLGGLVANGQYRPARSLWSELHGIHPAKAPLLYDPRFRDPQDVPFAWQLTSSELGLAEPQAGGRLHILYYGRDDGSLARQLLTLAPGRYRLALQMLGSGSHPELLRWSVQCAGARLPLSSVDIRAAAVGGLVFEVPGGCEAQWLELIGKAPELSQQADVTISGLRLSREGGGA